MDGLFFSRRNKNDFLKRQRDEQALETLFFRFSDLELEDQVRITYDDKGLF